MENASNHLEELDPLLDSLVDRGLTVDEHGRLAQLLRSDAAARRRYVQFMTLHARLETKFVSPPMVKANDQCGMMNDELPSQAGIVIDLHVAAPIHHSSFSIQHSLPSPVSSLPTFVGGVLFSYLAAALIVGVALIVAAVWKLPEYTQIAGNPSRPAEERQMTPDAKMRFVGRITGMVDCQGEGLRKNEGGRMKDELPTAGDGLHPSSFIPHPSSPVALGDKFSLASGLMEITYDTGAKVILQGPVTYEVDSPSGGYLSVGKLTARIEKKEERRTRNEELSASRSSFLIPHSYFAVRTRTATVTDLGTEFGVEVRNSGTTSAHVFRGSVNVQLLAADGRKEGEGLVLHEDESVQTKKSDTADGPAITVHRVAADPTAFVRQLIQPPKVIDLLDIVAGGNGTGHHRERGIDPTSGMEDPVFVTEHRVGDGRYQVVSWHKLIDGTFIPNGTAGPVVLDSAGHTFDGFPRTAGETFGSIWSRAATVKPDNLALDGDKHWVYAMGPGTQYMPSSRGLLHLCPNVGITLNLQAMREMYPNVRPVRFRTVAGVANALGLADIWVFVDGQLISKRTQIRMQDGPIAVDAEIGAREQFLTLVSTDGGDGIQSDWVVLGDPRVEMQLIETESEN